MFDEDRYDRNACGGLFFLLVVVFIIIGLVCVFIAASRPRTAEAADLDGRWFTGVRYSAFRPDDDDFRRDRKHEFQELGSIEAGYQFNEHIALSVEYGTQRFKAKYFPVSFRDHYVLLNGRASILMGERLLLYGVAGVGTHIYSDLDIPWYYERFWGCRITRTVGFGAKYGGGAEWFLTDNFALTVEGAYHYGDTGKGSSYDVYGWAGGFGGKWYF